MLPLDSDHLKGLDKPTELQQFDAQYVKQIELARQSIFVEICNDIGVGYDHRFIAARYLKNLEGITKGKIAEWLETVCHILDMFSIPWLQKAAPLSEEVHDLRIEAATLKTENSMYHYLTVSIITLQNQLIEKQDEQLKSVKSTVQRELKTLQDQLSEEQEKRGNSVKTELKSHSASLTSTVEIEMKSHSKAVTKSCSTALAPRSCMQLHKK